MPVALEKPENQLRLLLAVVLGGLILIIPQVAKYFGDEAYYTDAAIQMLRTGDYWTPYYPDGRMRFVKPIFTYWAIVASYLVFGINFFSSRFPFVLAGCGVMFLTYRLAMLLLEDQTKAAVAALIMGSNVQVLTISIRSTPDILLCLWVLISFIGFVRILFRGDRCLTAYLLAYGGAGLAVQTKGVLGFFPVVFAALFCLLEPKGARDWRSLWDWRAVAAGALLAFFWYVRMLALHGNQVVAEFFGDQVSRKVSFSPLGAVGNLTVYTTGVLRHFLPWSALLAVGLVLNRQTAVAFWRQRGRLVLFLAGWFLFVMLVFSPGNLYRTRYMVICYPMLSILFAALLADLLAIESFQLLVSRAFGWLAAVVVRITAVLTLLGVWIGWRVGAAGALLTMAAGFVLLVTRRQTRSAYPLAVACMPLVGFLAFELFLRPFFVISPAAALSARLVGAGVPVPRVCTWNVPGSLQAQLRVFSGGGFAVQSAGRVNDGPLPSDVPVVMAETDRSNWHRDGYVFEQVGHECRRWSVHDLRTLLEKPGRPEARRNYLPYYIAWPVELASQR